MILTESFASYAASGKQQRLQFQKEFMHTAVKNVLKNMRKSTRFCRLSIRLVQESANIGDRETGMVIRRL